MDLVTYFEWNPYEIYGSTFNEIFSLNVLNKKRVEKLKSFPIEKAEEILRVSKQNGWKVVTPSSAPLGDVLASPFGKSVGGVA